MKVEPIAASRIERELLETWDSAFDMIAKRGIALGGGSASKWASAFLGIVIFGAGLLWFTQGGNILLPLAACLAGGWVIVRAINAAEEGPFVVRDEGIDLWHEGREKRIHWGGLERYASWGDERFRAPNGEVFAFPGNSRTRDAVLDIVRWCAAVRGDIAGAEGSLLGAIDEMAVHGKLRFRFDRRRAFGEVAVASALLAFFVWLGFSIWSDRGVVGDLVVFGGLSAFGLWWLVTSISSLSDLDTEILVSDRGLSKSKGGRTIASLSWHEVSQPPALKIRWENRLLASSPDGKTRIDGTGMIHARALEAVVDHLLVRELERRGLKRTLKVADVRREPVPNTD
jgi:hypothetical protein